MISWDAMRAIFFDLDGTLTDPYEGVMRSLRVAFDALGLPLPDPDDMRSFIGPPLQVALRARFDDDALVDAIVRRFRERYGAVGMFENVVYPGVMEMLAAACPARLLVCTSKPRVYATAILERFALAGAFAAVYGSELDGTRSDKRELLAFALAVEHLDPGDDVALIGDRDLDIAAARANGVSAWGATWGYGSANELCDAGADHLFDSPREVAAALITRRGA
jgi:phosphoglycolate phosphatase